MKEDAIWEQMRSDLVSQVLVTSKSIFMKQDALWEQMGVLYSAQQSFLGVS